MECNFNTKIEGDTIYVKKLTNFIVNELKIYKNLRDITDIYQPRFYSECNDKEFSVIGYKLLNTVYLQGSRGK